jgi:GNAT superfamily N-acetyltransferase
VSAGAETGRYVLDSVRSHDLERVVELASSLGPRYSCDPDDPATARVFDLYARSDDKGGLVARAADGEAVGVYLFDLTPIFSPTHLHARGDLMAVDPAHRGRGLADRMMRAAWEIAAERRVTSFLCKSSVPGVIEWYRRVPELEERGVYYYYDPDPALLRRSS